MDISSESIADSYSQDMLLKDAKHQNEIASNSGNINNDNIDKENNINLYNNVNTNVKILNEIKQDHQNSNTDDRNVVKPIDLSSSSRNIENNAKILNPMPGTSRQTSSKREEILNAAKTLFSKRARNLYNWLCPTTSKATLKSTITAAWDTLSSAEKDFYISQVLGRFGPQKKRKSNQIFKPYTSVNKKHTRTRKTNSKKNRPKKETTNVEESTNQSDSQTIILTEMRFLFI